MEVVYIYCSACGGNDREHTMIPTGFASNWIECECSTCGHRTTKYAMSLVVVQSPERAIKDENGPITGD